MSLSRRVRDRVATALVWGAVAAATIPVVALMFTVARKGAGVMSLGFLTDDLPIQSRSAGGGIGPAVVGTLAITGTAALLAVPIGVAAAVYIVEYGENRWLGRAIKFMAGVMAGLPSIVMGLFVFAVWVLRFKARSGLAGSLALACLMLPVVISSSESMVRLVPRELREASFALGARQGRTIRTVVLPAALPGIVNGCLLAIARAAGETAPLLFTIGVTYTKTFNPFRENTALATQIFANASTSFAAAQQRAWGAALTLIGIVVVLMVVARSVSSRFAMPAR